ncbi:MAG TPA: cysteine desulfurase family protein [Bdellovibrionota bacterium]|nr:cysteine desulfurase family protein [Bdellovibrionota bacterium]
MSARTATYLDSNSGAPLRPSVVEALRVFFEKAESFSNPSSIHSQGRKARSLMAGARESVAASLGITSRSSHAESIIFTSSGTEANQFAIRSVLEPRLLRGEKPHWVTTAVEHDSTFQMIRWFEERGGTVATLPVDREGAFDASALAALWRPETVLVSAIWVNNETGVISDIQALSKAVSARGGLLHLDAAQAWGKLPIDMKQTGAALVSFSGHKIGALPGTGVLWAKPGLPVSSVIYGKQERGRRGGTENLTGIVSLGAAARSIACEAWHSRVEASRNRLETALRERISGVIVNGSGAPRVANTSNLLFRGISGEGLVLALDLEGYSVSAGAACSSGTLEPSRVLMEMGRSKDEALSAIRISLADELSWEELDGFVSCLARVVERLRRQGRTQATAQLSGRSVQ